MYRCKFLIISLTHNYDLCDPIYIHLYTLICSNYACICAYIRVYITSINTYINTCISTYTYTYI